jgi:triosephosphate isomerase
MRLQIAAANWKMNATLDEAKNLLSKLAEFDSSTLPNHHKVIISVPFPYLLLAKEYLGKKHGFMVAAQNCYTQAKGAFTGEVSAPMLSSMNVDAVLIGHSERREYFSETNDMLAQKVNMALENELTPVFCCGEPLAIREANTQNEYVAKQLKESLYHLSSEQLMQVVIAYEPIWAIGTGRTASDEQAQEMHAFIRSSLAAQYGNDLANEITILYGGSVKGSNAAGLFAQSDVDGGLVGGASLNADEFIQIIQSLS